MCHVLTGSLDKVGGLENAATGRHGGQSVGRPLAKISVQTTRRRHFGGIMDKGKQGARGGVSGVTPRTKTGSKPRPRSRWMRGGRGAPDGPGGSCFSVTPETMHGTGVLRERPPAAVDRPPDVPRSGRGGGLGAGAARRRLPTVPARAAGETTQKARARHPPPDRPHRPRPARGAVHARPLRRHNVFDILVRRHPDGTLHPTSRPRRPRANARGAVRSRQRDAQIVPWTTRPARTRERSQSWPIRLA
jgi:hypothetical protein